MKRRKTRILVECPAMTASVRVGVLELLQLLIEKQICEAYFKESKRITRDDIAWCDILVCVRGFEVATLHIAKAAKASGRFLVYFLDDDLLNIPAGNDSSRIFQDSFIQMNLSTILSMSDVLWVVNELIAEKYSKWCKRAVKLCVLGKVHRMPPVHMYPMKFIYAGSTDHASLIREQLVPAIVRFQQEHPGKAEFTFIGPDPQLSVTNGVSYYPFFEEYGDYQGVMLNGDFSVGLAPIRDSQFYASKYYNKFVEYTSFGILGIYSNLSPYTQVVRHMENGYFCEVGVNKWFEAILWAVEHPLEVARLAQNAQNEIHRYFNADVIAKDLLEKIPELGNFNAVEKSAFEIHLPSLQAIFLWDRIRLLWRIHGLYSVAIIPYKATVKMCRWIYKK